ncbi:hypothetical protein JCM15579A_30410 [Marinifilum fragile]
MNPIIGKDSLCSKRPSLTKAINSYQHTVEKQNIKNMYFGYFLNFLGFIVLRFLFQRKVKYLGWESAEWKFVRVGIVVLIVLFFLFGKLIEYTTTA